MKNTFCFLVGLLISTQLVMAETHFNAEQADKDFRLAVKSIENKKYKDAVNIFSELASEEIPEAQFNLALLLFNGLGVPKSYKDALFWAWKARLNNHETAQRQINQILDIITPELQTTVAEQIIAELDALARTGDEQASLKLGITFIELLVEPNYPAAYVWLSIAQAYGIEEASTLLTEVSDLMVIEEILVQQEEASKLFLQINN